MSRTPQTRRLVLLTASTALVAGGTLLPSSAFAAPATAHLGNASVTAADTPDLAIDRAIAKTEKFDSAQVDMTMTSPPEGPVAMEGTFSWGDGPAMDVEVDAKAVDMQHLVSDGTVRCLFTDGAYYYEVDPQSSGPLKGKHWMKIDASALFGEQSASELSGVTSGGATSGLELLALSDDVKNVGEETVRGKKTTHYRGVISKDDLGGAADALMRGDKGSPVNEFTGDVKEITMDVWLDGNDLPVRTKDQTGAVTVTTDFEKFGPTRAVEAPPAADTADMSDAVRTAVGSGPQV